MSEMREITYRQALNEALREELERDPNVFLMGEEVAEYNGAYKISQGLLERFGPKRVMLLGTCCFGVGVTLLAFIQQGKRQVA